jgi:hypothetical protein
MFWRKHCIAQESALAAFNTRLPGSFQDSRGAAGLYQLTYLEPTSVVDVNSVAADMVAIREVTLHVLS